MLVFSYGLRAPVRVTNRNSLKAAINSAKGEITLCEQASLERDEGAGREYYAFSYPRLIITKHFGGYTVAFCKKAWDDERVASGGEKLSKPLMLECAEQFMGLLSDPDFEAEEKLPSCVGWEKRLQLRPMYIEAGLDAIRVTSLQEVSGAVEASLRRGAVLLCGDIKATKHKNTTGIGYSTPQMSIYIFPKGYYLSLRFTKNGYSAIGDKDDNGYFETIGDRGEKERWRNRYLVSKEQVIRCAEQFMVLLSDPDFEAEEKLPSCVEWE